MWNNRERDLMYQGGSMNFNSIGPEPPFMQNVRFPPPNYDFGRPFFSEEVRKRKTTDTDLASHDYDGIPTRNMKNLRGNLGHLPFGESTSQHNLVFPQAVDSQPKNPEMFFSHNLNSAKPGNADSQYENYQYFNVDKPLLRLQTNDDDIKKASIGSVSSVTIHHEESSFKQPVQEFPKLLDSQQFAEPSKFQSYYNQNVGWMESNQTALRPNNKTLLGHGNNNLACNPHPYPSNIPSAITAVPGSSHFTMVNPDGGIFSQDFHRSRSLEVKTTANDTALTENRNSFQISTFSERREPSGSYLNPETAVSSGNYNRNGSLGPHMNFRDKEQGGFVMHAMPMLAESTFSKEAYPDYSSLNNITDISKDFGSKIMEKPVESSTENKTHLLLEPTPSEINKVIAGSPVEIGEGLPLKSEQSQPVAGKVSPVIIEKLWDGSLQLNTSTTVSAVAVFKSGEKAQDINWSDHVEIKGKVRLPAFEKFIQELPRSRNRSLMVISLCWKVGSSKAGLVGMKEVAKGYRESERVGFAQICPGIDLYVCPCSDTIITILAKYGFFKGMAAVEEDQDSLIGCVIWRRNQPSSNPTLKASQKKMDPCLPQVNSPLTSLHDSETKKSRQCTREPENATSKDSSLDSGNFQANSVPDLTPQLPHNFSVIPVRPRTVQETAKQTDLPIVEIEEPKKPDTVAQVTQPVIPRPPPTSQVQQVYTTSDYSHNIGIYYSGPAPVFAPSFSLDSASVRNQLPSIPEPGVSSGNGTAERDSKAENPLMHIPQSMKPSVSTGLTQPALPGPPPLPPEILHQILQSRRDACKAPLGGMPIAETACMHTGEPMKPSAGFETTGYSLPQAPPLLPQAEQRPPKLDDDDEDLPEFDFHSACGVSDAPTSKFPWSSSIAHISDAPPFNKQVPVEGVRSAGGLMPPPVLQPVEVVQRPQDPSFPAPPINAYHETALPTKLGEVFPENKISAAADIPQLLGQQFPANVDTDLSGGTSAPKNRWDDDDMPEWCPPDLEHMDQPTQPEPSMRIPSPNLRPASRNALPSFPSPNPTRSFHSSPRNPGAHLPGSQSGLLGPCPTDSNSATSSHAMPAARYAQSGPRPRPPIGRQPDHSRRPRASKFNDRPSFPDGRWRWKRN